MANASSRQENGASQIQRVTGAHSNVPEASLKLDDSSSRQTPELPATVDSVTGPDFHNS